MVSSSNKGPLRKAHFLGAKLRALRKRNNLTLEDLSLRCMQVDRAQAPSVSYLSMIENGKRMPSQPVLKLLAEVLQKPPRWFLDETPETGSAPRPRSAGGIEGIALEPGFLFSKELLSTALPELLAQTGTTGRQFAHLLIRSHQETRQNQFPDLERAAEDVGGKLFPLDLEALHGMCKKLGLKIQWFDRAPFLAQDDSGGEVKTLARSFFDAPDTLYINRRLQDQPARLKYDLASHIGHKVLHGGDGLRSWHASGGHLGGSLSSDTDAPGMDAQDVLFAWRDFESSFFAGALLCPKLPFRQFLIRNAYDVHAGEKLELTPSVIMRRMTAVSPYRHWHYFDAYPPGRLRAVYRGNGIPLPWGNMRRALDPCRQWAVFRMLNRQTVKPCAQISVLQENESAFLYCCRSLRTRDAAGNVHVICAGIDLSPALESQGFDAREAVEAVGAACRAGGGSAEIPREVRAQLETVAKVLNIGWVSEGLASPASIICPRSSACPRPEPCAEPCVERSRPWLDEIKSEILGRSQAASSRRGSVSRPT